MHKFLGECSAVNRAGTCGAHWQRRFHSQRMWVSYPSLSIPHSTYDCQSKARPRTSSPGVAEPSNARVDKSSSAAAPPTYLPPTLPGRSSMTTYPIDLGTLDSCISRRPLSFACPPPVWGGGSATPWVPLLPQGAGEGAAWEAYRGAGRAHTRVRAGGTWACLASRARPSQRVAFLFSKIPAL